CLGARGRGVDPLNRAACANSRFAGDCQGRLGRGWTRPRLDTSRPSTRLDSTWTDSTPTRLDTDSAHSHRMAHCVARTAHGVDMDVLAHLVHAVPCTGRVWHGRTVSHVRAVPCLALAR